MNDNKELRKWGVRLGEQCRRLLQANVERCDPDPDRWEGTEPFHNHLYAQFTIPDGEISRELADQAFKYHMEEIMENMKLELSKTDMAEFRALPIYGPEAIGVWQYIFNEAEKMPVRVTARYDIVQQGTVYTFDLLFRQVGNWYFPIIGGPMDGLLFPFKNVPYDGQNITYEYFSNRRPSYEYTTWEDEECTEHLYPGVDLELVGRMKTTLHEYKFIMPYVYYMGETLK